MRGVAVRLGACMIALGGGTTLRAQTTDADKISQLEKQNQDLQKRLAALALRAGSCSASNCRPEPPNRIGRRRFGKTGRLHSPKTPNQLPPARFGVPGRLHRPGSPHRLRLTPRARTKSLQHGRSAAKAGRSAGHSTALLDVVDDLGRL